MNTVRIGDRLEMKRQGYCHWAVFVGVQYVVLDDDAPHVLVPCVVHRNNPADDPSLIAGSGLWITTLSKKQKEKTQKEEEDG